ncbi:MAG TPA: DNA adenine methylase [Leptospiraceae bacterium]|nr:DNA adenine methylase [Leptospiraceae bacterium]
MKYMGSKARIAKEILPIILKNRKENQWYVEPFVGGCNSIQYVKGPRIGNDIHEELIAFCKALQSGWNPPDISEKEYYTIKENKANYPKELLGYVGFQLTYGAKYFDSYRRDSTGRRNYSKEAKEHVLKQASRLKDIIFYNKNYLELDIPPLSLIYCDPPYRNTTKYKSSLDYNKFYSWCRQQKEKGHTIFISEYTMPEDFICIWQKKINSSLTQDTGSKQGIEKLFTL